MLHYGVGWNIIGAKFTHENSFTLRIDSTACMLHGVDDALHGQFEEFYG